jgi:GNAT superfamily N-acetyltransferase
MDEGLRIRRTTRADLPALTAMTREFNDHLDGIGGQAPAEDAADIATAAMNRLDALAFGPQPICTVLVAEQAREAVGYLTYFIGVYMDDATPALHIADFFVRTGHRRRGAGKALMLEVRRIAQDLGASRLLWTVWRRNSDAIRFYENLGAELEPDDGSVLMQWLIKP